MSFTTDELNNHFLPVGAVYPESVGQEPSQEHVQKFYTYLGVYNY